MLTAALALLTVGASALLLGIAGVYRWPLAVVLGLAMLVPLIWIAARSVRSSSGDAGPRAGIWAVAALVVALAISASATRTDSQHVLHDRDPAVYVSAARWLSEDGSLQMSIPDPFLDEPDLVLTSPGIMREGDGAELQFQFSHLVPAVLAVASDVSGTGAVFRLTALVGGLALIALYGVGATLTGRPWAALVAMTVVGVSLPFVAHVRDVYSEPYTMVFLWTGLLALGEGVRRRDSSLAALAGILAGGCLISRIDGMLYVAGALAALAWMVLRTPPADLGAMRRTTSRFALGIVPGAAISMLDIGLRSIGYARMVRSQLIGLGLAIVVAAALLLVADRRARRRTAGPTVPRSLVTVVSIGTGVALAALWLIPLPILSAPTQTFAGIAGWVSGVFAPEPIEFAPGATFHWRALEWLSWYVGPLLLVAAIGGAVILVSRTLTIAREAETLLIVMFLTSGVGYVLRPSISPDQIWATRRFLTFVLPALALFAAVALVAIARAGRRHAPALPRVALPAVLSAALLAPPVLTTWRVRELTDQGHALDGLRQLCAELGSDAAVLVVQQRYWDLTYLQPLTTWCGVEAAGVAPDADPDLVRRVADRWRDEGRDLFLVSSTASADSTSALEPFVGAGVAGTITRTPMVPNDRVLAHTFGGPPDEYWTVPIGWDVAPIAEGSP